MMNRFQLKEGRIYVARNGDIYGPVREWTFGYFDIPGQDISWFIDGRRFGSQDDPIDLVAEA